MGIKNLHPCLTRASTPRGAPHEVLLLPHPSLHLQGGPELSSFMLPRIPQPVNSQPRACQGKNNVFQPRCSAGFHTTHSAAKAKPGPFLNIPSHLQSRKPRRCCGTACSWRGGCFFWQGNAGSAHAILVVDSQDQCRDPSALGVLLHWQKRAGFGKKPCKNWFCSDWVCNDLPARESPPIDQFVYENIQMKKAELCKALVSPDTPRGVSLQDVPVCNAPQDAERCRGPQTTSHHWL